jgi:hypothetical protein
MELCWNVYSGLYLYLVARLKAARDERHTYGKDLVHITHPPVEYRAGNESGP